MERLDREFRSLPMERPPSAEALARLGLLDRVIKESLRLLPSVVYLPRITSRPEGRPARPLFAQIQASWPARR